MLTIKYTDEQHLGTGDFGAAVKDDKLVLPPEVQAIAPSLRNANQFFSTVLCYPTLFATSFGWTPEETKQATDKIREQLRGHVADAILDFDVSKAPKFPVGGAIPPSNAKIKPNDMI